MASPDEHLLLSTTNTSNTVNPHSQYSFIICYYITLLVPSPHEHSKHAVISHVLVTSTHEQSLKHNTSGTIILFGLPYMNT